MYDTIIIGGGVTGLGAAWYLTEKLGKKTLVLEQFPFPHQFGSSAGHSRITRQLYEDYFNCNLMKEATALWRELQCKTNLKLFIENGTLIFGLPEEINKYIIAINLSGISAHVISSQEAREKFPLFNIPQECTILYDPFGGVLRADRCLQALMNRSLEYGLEFHEMEKVIDISVISNDEIDISTNNGLYKTKSVIIASGIWSKKLLEKLDCELPLEPVRIHCGYFNSKNKDDLKFNYNNFPSFISTNKNIYGCSGMEYPGCLKVGDFTDEPVNPDEIDSNVRQSQSKSIFLGNVQSFLKQIIPLASQIPIKVQDCVIMKTPDDQPIIDRHPKFKNVIIGCGFCGCGFKTGVIHGKLLANMATDQNNENMEMFSISRF